ncbi:hypothetical protein ACH5RR_021415 [Cinchona calisaya]|uniref:Uncharacterized protein n=1 Tax=Cinchona calisaya TaxID=153742 RepID=A0ABD2ZH90_9GENT
MRSFDISHVPNVYKTILISGLVLSSTIIFYYVIHPKSPTNSFVVSRIEKTLSQSTFTDTPTNISHLVFGIVGSEGAWHHRKGYGEAWWQPNVTRGYLYLDIPPTVDILPWSLTSPPYRVSEDLTKLINEINPAVPILPRVLHAILEIFREEDHEGFRWLVMGDDDTIFFVDNMVDVLAKYDHTKYYYIGSPSECLNSNFRFSFNMGFGGAGFALSYPLVKAFANNVEDCLKRYSHLVTGDIIEMSCIADFGVNLSPQKGLHQIDLRGDISGLLSSHPKTPLMSLHHLDVVDPIFPNMDAINSIHHLMKAANIYQSRLLQQTICYNRKHNWSISVSWGYSVHIYEKIMPRSLLQLPIETFQPWAANPNPPFYMFNTRLPSNDQCESPHVFFFDSIEKMSDNLILTTYYRRSSRELPPCVSSSHSADYVTHIYVYSSVTKRIEINRCECCDHTYAEGAKNAVLKFRECMPDEIMA